MRHLTEQQNRRPPLSFGDVNELYIAVLDLMPKSKLHDEIIRVCESHEALRFNQSIPNIQLQQVLRKRGFKIEYEPSVSEFFLLDSDNKSYGSGETLQKMLESYEEHGGAKQ